MATEAQPTVMAACRPQSEESLQRCQKTFSTFFPTFLLVLPFSISFAYHCSRIIKFSLFLLLVRPFTSFVLLGVVAFSFNCRQPSLWRHGRKMAGMWSDFCRVFSNFISRPVRPFSFFYFGASAALEMRIEFYESATEVRRATDLRRLVLYSESVVESLGNRQPVVARRSQVDITETTDATSVGECR